MDAVCHTAILADQLARARQMRVDAQKMVQCARDAVERAAEAVRHSRVLREELGQRLGDKSVESDPSS
jgi:hypothetical protein